MDETQTPPPEVSGEMQTESTIPASIADTTAPESQTTEPEVVPEPVQRPPLDVTLEPAQSIQGVPLDIVARGESADNALPVIQVEANSPGPTIEHSNILQNIGMLKGDENGSIPVVNIGMSDSQPEESRVVEKVVEKEVIKEVIKEVPVEKIIEKEKIVYRDMPAVACPPPTPEEREAIKHDFLIELSHEGTAKKHELMLQKLATILTLFDHKQTVMREDVMDALDCSGTTAYLFAYSVYDPIGRVLTVVDSVGTTTNTYSDWSLRVTDPLGNKKDLWKDSRGNLAQVVEYPSATSSATTTYSWNLLGKLTKLNDALGNVRNFSYDTLGRLLTSEDLHAPADATFGTSSWSYDDANNVVSFLNPRFQTVNYTYDVLNRVKTEDYTGASGTEIAYTYDAGTNGKGRMTQNIRQGGATTTMSYNPIGLTASEGKLIGGVWATTSYVYLRNGLIDTVTYPNNEQIWTIYSDAGNLNQVLAKKPASTTWQKVIELTNYGPNGLPVFQDYGNNTQTTWSYDSTQKYRLIRKTTVSTSTIFGIPETLSL